MNAVRKYLRDTENLKSSITEEDKKMPWGVLTENNKYDFRKLNTLESSHLENIMITQTQITARMRATILMILRDRTSLTISLETTA